MDMVTEITIRHDITIPILDIIMEMDTVTDMDNKVKYLFRILQTHPIQTGYIHSIITNKDRDLYLVIVITETADTTEINLLTSHSKTDKK